MRNQHARVPPQNPAWIGPGARARLRGRGGKSAARQSASGEAGKRGSALLPGSGPRPQARNGQGQARTRRGGAGEATAFP